MPVKTICHFKDSCGPVAIKTDRIVSIEGEENDDGTKYTCITVDGSNNDDELVEYHVQNSVMESISEWERALKLQNS